MMSVPTLTAGRITALWGLIRLCGRLEGQTGVPAESLLRLAQQSSMRGGGLPFEDGYQLALSGRFLERSAGMIQLTPTGKSALALNAGDEPSAAATRFITERLLLLEPPSWVPFLGGIKHGMPFNTDVIPPVVRRSMEAVGMLNNTPESKWFWTALTAHPHQLSDAQRKSIGTLGEQLTVDFERKRLCTEGFPHLADRVQWVATDTDAYGYDVHSFAGRLHGGAPDRALAIDVKATTAVTSRQFRLFLTKHEWNVARLLTPNYVFYFWTGVTPEAHLSGRLWLLHDISALHEHLPGPSDCDDARCRWQTCELTLNLGNCCQSVPEPTDGP